MKGSSIKRDIMTGSSISAACLSHVRIAIRQLIADR